MTDTTRPDPAHTVVLRPGDTLLIGNLGHLVDLDEVLLRQGLRFMAKALGLANVSLFEQDIDIAATTPVVPMPDAVVIRAFDREAVARHRAVLAAWMEANGIDPVTVAPHWLSVEQSGTQRILRYPAYRLNEDGRRLLDPRSPDHSWTVERVSPVVIDLDLTTLDSVTQSD